MAEPELFPADLPTPDGFVYQPEFISTAEENELVAAIERLEFAEIRMHGVVAKRRTVQFGKEYGFATFKLTEAPPIPDFLLPVRSRVSDLTGIAADDFAEALVTEYRAGAQIGWHRDAPGFDVVAGISLLSECTMQFRAWPVATGEARVGKSAKPLRQVLAPRSAYVLRGSVRTQWQHHIPPTKALRYSVTFRTLRQKS